MVRSPSSEAPLSGRSPRPSIARGREPATPAPDLLAGIAAAVARRADRVAVEAPDARLTYAELDRLSNRLARRLLSAGVGPESCVGISLPRGAGELVAMLATSKAGGAYVPLDPSHPLDRLRIVQEDAAPAVMVVHPSSPLAGAATTAEVIVLDDLARATDGFDAAPPPAAHDPAQLAYVLFTSGSTGRPKGVEISRGAFANFMRAMAHEPGLREDDRLLAVSTTSFDIAGLELFLPLYTGATVVIADRATVMDPRKLRARLESDAITFMQATPATWRLLLEAGWRGGRELRMLCGGEAMSAALAERLLGCGAELWNMYGPTETTVWSSVHRIRPGVARISVGRPIDRTQIYVMDDARRPVGLDAVGELYIGGAGLARGYRGRPDLTAERFLPHPAGPPGELLYRTGDLGRMAADGTVECLGRVDHQVKIRGYRVELGEIEAVLRRVEGVREVLVIADDREGDPRLCAYWVGPAARDALIEAARKALPAYMVPACYARLDSFPLTPNGKIDRQRLPRPADAAPDAAEPIKRARDDTETRLAAIWCELLGRQQVGVDQSFFTLGGTSILAVETCARIEKETGVEIPLASFFASPTIEALAPYVSRVREAESPGAPVVVHLRRGRGDRAPLFCLLGVHLYQDLAAALGADRPVVGMHIPFRHVPGVDPRPSVARMAAGYRSSIRRRQPHGPYHLAGLCFGGVVAFEVARQLEAEGEEVALVAVIDGSLPGGMRIDQWGRVFWHARRALRDPTRIGAALRGGLAKLRGRLAPRPAPVAGKPVDVEIDGPQADAEIARFAAGATPIHATLLVFRALVQPLLPDWLSFLPHLGWQGLSDRLIARDVDATHLGLLREPEVRVLARVIGEVLDAEERLDEERARRPAGAPADYRAPAAATR
jgi:amino acid adenylation domain-containing protein